MIKKKVLVQGSLKTLHDFFSSKFSFEFDPVAVLTDEVDKIAVIFRQGGGSSQSLDAYTPENLPRAILKFIDGVVLTDIETRNENINRLFKIGLEPRKIILWNNRGIIETFGTQAKDGSNFIFMEGLQFHIRNEDDAKFFQQMYGTLQNQRQMYAVNPQFYPAMVAQRYQNMFKKPLDLNNLQTWTEKMQWIKLFDSTPLKTRLADKYLVRQWIAEKIGQEYLIPLLGVWDNFDEINFDILPNQFVLKCNHGSAMNIICRDKNNFDFEGAKQKLTSWLQVDYGMRSSFEPHYCNIPRKIIAEKFMSGSLQDFKFWCFDSKPVYCGYETGRTSDLSLDNLRIDFFDMDWNRTEIERYDHPNSDHPEKIVKPKNFELMKKLAAELCKGFAHVRVDFYEIEGKIYFGGMTFTPAAGFIKWNSQGTDKLFGDLMKLPAPSKFPINASNFELNYSVRQKISPTKNILPRKKIPLAKRVIASLTSWTKRIATVHLAIQTILAQTRQPDLTVLYLADSEFPNREKDLPRELTALVSDRFEIRWTKDIKSYKKLIPALKDFPDDVIITFDDDVLYDRRAVEILMNEYAKNPQYIHCHRSSRISLNEKNEISSETFSNVPLDKPSYLNRFTGVGGVLYPPHSLHEEVMREEKFMTLAPTNDDIWFLLMGVMNGFKVNVVKHNLDRLNKIPGTQGEGVALWLNNNLGDKLFFVHLQNILDAYPVLKDILESEWRKVSK